MRTGLLHGNRGIIFFLSVLLSCAFIGVQAQTWEGGVGDWSDGENWDSGDLPTVGVYIINDGDEVSLKSDVPDILSLQIGVAGLPLAAPELVLSDSADLKVSGGRIAVGYDEAGNTGVLTMKAGVLSGDRNIVIGIGGGIGTLNLEGGTLTHHPGLGTIGFAVGSGSGSEGYFNMTGGTANIDRDVFIGHAGGTGTFSLSGGSHNVLTGNNMVVAESDSAGSVKMTGGTLTVQSGQLNVGSLANSTGTFTVSGGTLNVTGTESDIGQSSGGTGTLVVGNGGKLVYNAAGNGPGLRFGNSNGVGMFVVYGDSDIEIKGSTHGNQGSLQMGRSNGESTLRAVIDSTGFNSIKASGTNAVTFGSALTGGAGGGTSRLEVELDGGIMLGAASYRIIDVTSGNISGDWDFTPGEDTLWVSTTGDLAEGKGVEVSLRSGHNLGKLDTSTLQNSVTISNKSVGFIEMEDVDTEKILHLRLGMYSGSVGSNIDDLITDLGKAGYMPVKFEAYGVDISLDPKASGHEYFAWDLSGYTSSGPLQIESITVIPEPSMLGMLAFAGFIVYWRRRMFS